MRLNRFRAFVPGRIAAQKGIFRSHMQRYAKCLLAKGNQTVLYNYNRFINLDMLESELRMFAFVERLLNLLHFGITQTQNISRHDIKT